MTKPWSGLGECFSLFEDTFRVSDIDREGKPFQYVSRIDGETELSHVQLGLDVNTEVYPIALGEYYSVSLVPSANIEGSWKENGSFNIHEDFSNSILAKYEYVMHGKVFKIHEDTKSGSITVVISFGGLILQLKGEEIDLSLLELDAEIFLLLKKLQ